MLKNDMALPNFLIIGAAKSGTSSLYMYLKQHPEIFMSPVKEPHFFSFDSESKQTNGPGDPIRKAITDYDQYIQLFNSVTDEKAIGEASTSYLYRTEAPNRIHALLPDVKIIVLLRNPVERAFSAYMHVVRDKRETSKTFSEALSHEEDRKRNHWDPIWHFTSVGCYYEQLLRYYKLFKKEQIRIYLYEELLTETEGLLSDIFKFLEVNPNFIPDFSVKFNVSGEQKSTFVQLINQYFFLSPNPVKSLSRLFIPEIWRWKFTSWLRNKNLAKGTIPELNKMELLTFYREDIINLQALIDRDLSEWLE